MKKQKRKILQILHLYDIFITKKKVTKNDSLKPTWLYDIKCHNM